ncbi:hypothetical protein Tco_0643511 [Tanacetum coccineum]
MVSQEDKKVMDHNNDQNEMTIWEGKGNLAKQFFKKKNVPFLVVVVILNTRWYRVIRSKKYIYLLHKRVIILNGNRRWGERFVQQSEYHIKSSEVEGDELLIQVNSPTRRISILCIKVASQYSGENKLI